MALAQNATDQEFKQYDLVRCLVAASPRHPPVQLAQALLVEMLEEMPSNRVK